MILAFECETSGTSTLVGVGDDDDDDDDPECKNVLFWKKCKILKNAK